MKSRTSTLDVICVGAANFDTITVLPQLPKADERVITNQIVDAGGGPAATAAVALAREGVRVGFCGVVGNDANGRAVRELLESEGVDTRWLRVDEDFSTPRTIAIVESESDTRALIAQSYPSPQLADIPVDSSQWLHLDQVGYAPAMRAIELSQSKVNVSLDAGNPIHDLTLRRIDLYVPTISALLTRYPEQTVKEALQSASREGPRLVAATDGARGVWIVDAGQLQHVPAFHVNVVSTLGAGDVFHGAILAGVLNGLPLKDAALRASAIAAISCRALDGRTGIPVKRETDEFLALRAAEVKLDIGL